MYRRTMCLGILLLSSCLLLTFSENNKYLRAQWETVQTDTLKTTIATFSLKPGHPPIAFVDSLRYDYDIRLSEKDSAGWIHRKIGIERAVREFSIIFIYPDSIFSVFVASVSLYEGGILRESLAQNYIPVQSWDNIRP